MQGTEAGDSNFLQREPFQSCIRRRIQRADLEMNIVYSGHRYERPDSRGKEITIQPSVTAQATGPWRGELLLKLRERADFIGKEFQFKTFWQ